MDQKILKTIQEHKKAIDNFENNSIAIVKRSAEMIIECLKNSGTVYLITLVGYSILIYNIFTIINSFY